MSDEEGLRIPPAGAAADGPSGRATVGRDPFAREPDDEALWVEALDRLQERLAERLEPPGPAGPGERGALGALLPGAERERLAALRRALAARPGPSELSIDTIERAYPLLFALYRLWFRVSSEGQEHLPAGPALLIANHGGLLPFDGAMLAVDVLRHTRPPRVLRPLVARFVERLPGVRTFYAQTGSFLASRVRLRELLAEGELVLVFPEGVEGITKTLPDRYRLRHFHAGFAEEALRAGVPVVPVGITGPEDQAPVLYDLRVVARRLGLPSFPITPTFPWLGPLGLVPYPVRYRIRYGAPMPEFAAGRPADADDTARAEQLAAAARCRVQRLVDQLRG